MTTLTDERKRFFIVRFTDTGEYVPYGWLHKNAVDAAYHVRLHKDRPTEVVEFENYGQHCKRKGWWDGETFLRDWLRQLEEREAQARADKRKVE